MNGVPRRTPTPTILASIEEAATAVPPTTRAIVTTTLRPTPMSSFLLVPLYTCSPERLSAMHL